MVVIILAAAIGLTMIVLSVRANSLFVLTLFAIGSITLTPRPGQEGMLIPSLIFIGGIFLAVQILHLWLIAKTLRGGE